MLIFSGQVSFLKGNEQLSVAWSLSNAEQNTRSWGPICSNEPAICVHVHRCALLPMHTWGCVCAIVHEITAVPVPLSSLGASWGYAWHSRMQGVCVCVSIHTLHPSQLPHMSTPHHIPRATAAITVTKESANSFITQSTRALMTPWTKLHTTQLKPEEMIQRLDLRRLDEG